MKSADCSRNIAYFYLSFSLFVPTRRSEISHDLDYFSKGLKKKKDLPSKIKVNYNYFKPITRMETKNINSISFSLQTRSGV